MNVEKLYDGILLVLYRSCWVDNIYMSKFFDNGRMWKDLVFIELFNNNFFI